MALVLGVPFALALSTTSATGGGQHYGAFAVDLSRANHVFDIDGRIAGYKTHTEVAAVLLLEASADLDRIRRFVVSASLRSPLSWKRSVRTLFSRE